MVDVSFSDIALNSSNSVFNSLIYLLDTVQKLLGQGTFGKVVSAYDSKEKTFVAVKIM